MVKIAVVVSGVGEYICITLDIDIDALFHLE